MPGKCEICGKSIQFGNRISHAHNKTKRVWHPNIQKVKAVINGRHRRINVCTSCLRSDKVVKTA
jgi:large subunit ribosomal protein L28